jgi:hypothetical protein
LDKLWWIIDFNRQSLDFIALKGGDGNAQALRSQGLACHPAQIWLYQEAFFKMPGDRLRDWIDECRTSSIRASAGLMAPYPEVIINWRGTRDQV